MTTRSGGLLHHPTALNLALTYLRRLFATPRSPGVLLAVQALGGIVDRATVETFMCDSTRDLLARF